MLLQTVCVLSTCISRTPMLYYFPQVCEPAGCRNEPGKCFGHKPGQEE